MKITIDRDLCQGHSVCVAEAPEVFRVIENAAGYPQVEVILDNPPAALREKVQAAVQYCPNHVITLIED